MTSTLELRLTDVKTGEVLLNDKGRNVALEVAGKIEEIL
jgi:PBP1b-binding outer membrane lipoprotein LpoB